MDALTRCGCSLLILLGSVSLATAREPVEAPQRYYDVNKQTTMYVFDGRWKPGRIYAGGFEWSLVVYGRGRGFYVTSCLDPEQPPYKEPQ